MLDASADGHDFSLCGGGLRGRGSRRTGYRGGYQNSNRDSWGHRQGSARTGARGPIMVDRFGAGDAQLICGFSRASLPL